MSPPTKQKRTNTRLAVRAGPFGSMSEKALAFNSINTVTDVDALAGIILKVPSEFRTFWNHVSKNLATKNVCSQRNCELCIAQHVQAYTVQVDTSLIISGTEAL